MALTRDFKSTIKKRLERDPAFREELLKEGIECLLTGDVDTGKAILRDFINATIGFDALRCSHRKIPEKPDAACLVPREIHRLEIFSKSLLIFKSMKVFTSRCTRCVKQYPNTMEA